jgi:hypothetical protein
MTDLYCANDPCESEAVKLTSSGTPLCAVCSEAYTWGAASVEVDRAFLTLIEECQHQPYEDCLNCTVCGQCSESVDERGVCADCVGEQAESGLPLCPAVAKPQSPCMLSLAECQEKHRLV